jgi:hypothetical protein
MSNLKWKPKDPSKFIGVPGKGYIAADDFTVEDQDALISRAMNRKIDVHTFMLGCGLVKVDPQVELELSEPKQEIKEEEIQPPVKKRGVKAKTEE